MTKIVLAMCASILLGLAASPAFSDSDSLKTDKDVQRFWQSHHPEGAASGGG